MSPRSAGLDDPTGGQGGPGPCETDAVPVVLRPLDPSLLSAWLERTVADYAEDLVAAGWNPDQAARHAAESTARVLTDGSLAPGHAVFEVLDDTGARAGSLWVGPEIGDDPTAWWVWEIVIDADRRGHGLGRAAMLAGEEYARSQGARTLGLNVFGFNTPARGLYESLGYATASVRMRKDLG